MLSDEQRFGEDAAFCHVRQVANPIKPFRLFYRKSEKTAARSLTWLSEKYVNWQFLLLALKVCLGFPERFTGSIAREIGKK